MPKATVQKYPQDETDLPSAIKALVDYFDQTAETARTRAAREQSERARKHHDKPPHRARHDDDFCEGTVL